MDADRHSCDQAEEDYIYMEVDSQFPIFSHYTQTSSSSPQQHAREFEFQMSRSSERDTAPSPADELFYKGKLLPLHLPPRLQMVEKLLQNVNIYDDGSCCKEEGSFEEGFSTPLFTGTNTPATSNTPFESCNVSPAESCQVSRELNPEEYQFEYSAESTSFVDENPKRSWTKKLKLIKQSSVLGSKLKASKSYLKSLFSKTACSNESCAAASGNDVYGGPLLKANECGTKYVKVVKKVPFGQVQKSRQQETSSSSSSSSVNKSLNKIENFDENGRGRHRRSFSGAIKRMSMNRSSSSLSSSSGSSSASSSNNSSGFRELPFFKRSNSVSSDIENPIQAAIAHCKKSQQRLTSRKNVSDLGFCTLNSSRVIYEDQRPGICRG